MKNILSILIIFLLALSASAQDNPVSFDYKVKKTGNKLYEVSIVAHVDAPWHIYSQYTPTDGPSLPTSIKFTRHPLIEMIGKTAEIGQLITKHEEVLDVNLKYFTGKVEFVQKVKLKGAIKTNLRGSIEYMVCTDGRCLSPTTVNFDVALN